MAASDYWHIFSIAGTFLVTFVATSYIYKKTPSVGPITVPKTSGVGDLFKDIFSYIPHTLLLFGVIADIFTYEGIYSIASAIGLASVPLNYVFGYLWGGLHSAILDAYNTATEGKEGAKKPLSSTPPAFERQSGGGMIGDYFKNYDGCNIQGLSGLESAYTIQTLVVTTTIMSYFMWDNITNRGWTNAAGTMVLFVILYAAGWFVTGDCNTDVTKQSALPPITGTMRKLISLIQGLFFGGVSYMIVEAADPAKLPSAAISPVPQKTKSDLKENADGTFTDEEGNSYSCLANGQCIPNLCDSLTRESIANKIGETLGTGKTVTAEECKKENKCD